MSWFEVNQLFFKVVVEFDDSVLFKVFGSEGFGVFCVLLVIVDYVVDFYNVVCIGEIVDIIECFYVIIGKNCVQYVLVNSIVVEVKILLGQIQYKFF